MTSVNHAISSYKKDHFCCETVFFIYQPVPAINFHFDKKPFISIVFFPLEKVLPQHIHLLKRSRIKPSAIFLFSTSTAGVFFGIITTYCKKCMNKTKTKEVTVIVFAWLFAIALCYIVYAKHALHRQ